MLKRLYDVENRVARTILFSWNEDESNPSRKTVNVGTVLRTFIQKRLRILWVALAIFMHDCPSVKLTRISYRKILSSKEAELTKIPGKVGSFSITASTLTRSVVCKVKQ